MGFYSDIQIQCVNPNAYYPWYSSRDMDISEMVSRYVVLTSPQLQKLGCSPETLGRLVKNGLLCRYKVTHPGGSLPSVFTAGNTAGKHAGLPVPRLFNMEDLRSILIVNQVLVPISLQPGAQINVSPRRPIQIITINKPTGVMYARALSYVNVPLRYDLTQAIIIIPDQSYACTGPPFRYVLEDELHLPEIQYYYCNGDNELLPVSIDFAKKDTITV